MNDACIYLGTFGDIMPLINSTADESEEVEQETQSLISTIETELGESIQQYFQ